MQLAIFKHKNKKGKLRGLSHTPKSFSHLHQSLRLNQIKPNTTAKEARKQANSTSRNFAINWDMPVYELVLNDVTMDLSNSVQYILTSQSHMGKNKNKAIIYKNEFGSKKVFFKQ